MCSPYLHREIPFIANQRTVTRSRGLVLWREIPWFLAVSSEAGWIREQESTSAGGEWAIAARFVELSISDLRGRQIVVWFGVRASVGPGKMSNQQTQPRVRRITSPSLKTGPMRATHPFGWRQGSSPTTVSSRSTAGRKGSPSSSPTPVCRTQAPSEVLRKNPRSPDHRTSPDRAGSPFINMKGRLQKWIWA